MAPNGVKLGSSYITGQDEANWLDGFCLSGPMARDRHPAIFWKSRQNRRPVGVFFLRRFFFQESGLIGVATQLERLARPAKFDSRHFRASQAHAGPFWPCFGIIFWPRPIFYFWPLLALALFIWGGLAVFIRLWAGPKLSFAVMHGLSLPSMS